MIAAQDISLRLNGRDILQQVNLKARPGELTVLLGPNGSGKTMLFRCLTGQYRPAGGRITLADRPLASLSQRRLAQLLALVPQEHHPVFPYRVRDIILLGRLPRLSFFGKPRRRDLNLVEKILQLLNLMPLADKPYTCVSGGERQLVLIGRCLAQEPEILLLDEPTSHLDLHNQVMVLKLLRDLAGSRNLTVLLTLHDPNLALMFADQVILLHQGRVITQGNPLEVIHPGTIRQLYGLEVDMLCQGERRLLYPRLS